MFIKFNQNYYSFINLIIKKTDLLLCKSVKFALGIREKWVG